MYTIDPRTRDSVRKITDYLHDDEEKHYEESDREAGHIFEDVQKVEEWLADNRPDVPTFPRVRIEQMESNRSGRGVANQFRISTDAGEFFQSYRSIIAFIPKSGKTVLDAKYWDYSTTTGKYRNAFLGEGIEETRRKINSGEYVLGDLN